MCFLKNSWFPITRTLANSNHTRFTLYFRGRFKSVVYLMKTIWYPHMWRFEIFTCEDIYDFADIKFVSLIVLKFDSVSSKHLRVFLESLRESSDIFGNFRKFTENVRERSSGLRNNFGKSSEIFGKSSKSPSSISLYKKRTFHVSSKIWILCSRGKNNIFDIVHATRTYNSYLLATV